MWCQEISFSLSLINQFLTSSHWPESPFLLYHWPLDLCLSWSYSFSFSHSGFSMTSTFHQSILSNTDTHSHLSHLTPATLSQTIPMILNQIYREPQHAQSVINPQICYCWQYHCFINYAIISRRLWYGFSLIYLAFSVLVSVLSLLQELAVLNWVTGLPVEISSITFYKLWI